MDSHLLMPDWVSPPELSILLTLISFTMVVLALLPSRKPGFKELEAEAEARRNRERLKLQRTGPEGSQSRSPAVPARITVSYRGELGRKADGEWRRARLRRYGALHQRRRHKDSPRRHHSPPGLKLRLA